MTRKKTVTDAVIAANQRNSQNSTGPNSEEGKANSRRNAMQHSLTAKIVLPENEGDDSEFQRELERWCEYYQPEGVWEETLVRKITRLQRKDAILVALEERELAHLRAEMGEIDSVFDNNLKLPIDWVDLPIQRGWDCERVVVRATSTGGDTHSDATCGPSVNRGQLVPGYRSSKTALGNKCSRLEVEAVLGSTLDKILRYRAALSKEMYRAVEALRAAQEERRERAAGG